MNMRKGMGLSAALLAFALLTAGILPDDRALLDATKRGDVVAVKAALKDAGIEGKRIEAVYSGTSRGGAMIGQRIMGRADLAHEFIPGGALQHVHQIGRAHV